ncbi:MAG: DNA polymerase III subunit alpha, partial [Clostridia bacterium]
KGAIKDVARVYGVPLDKVNKTTKSISNDPKMTLDKALGHSTASDDLLLRCPEVIETYNNDPEMRKVIDMALKIEGMPRNCSKHAAGVVICREVISDFVPLQKNGDDITTQFQKEEVEELGMLKMDFLGLTTLTDISKAKKYIFENSGVEVDFEKLGYDDPEVYKLICSGETDAVFQLEGAGIKDFIKKMQPTSLEDIIAGISLYRPGPMDSIPAFLAAKARPDKIVYPHPLLEPILKMTYGVLVYQEQVM